MIDVANSNAVYYYHGDGLGSVMALCDVNSVPVERYAYDVFGRPTIRDANGVQIGQSAFGNPYLFTARAYDAESGLYYYRARYYDHATARFLQPDPIGYDDGLNIYTYCGGDPVNHNDPFGLAIWLEGASGGEPPLHMSISVGDPKGSYQSFSFGVEHRYEALWGKGHVYYDTVPGGRVGRIIQTSPQQDQDAVELLEYMADSPSRGTWWYNVAISNCRTFSKTMFDYFRTQTDFRSKATRKYLPEFWQEMDKLGNELKQAQSLIDWYNRCKK